MDSTNNDSLLGDASTAPAVRVILTREKLIAVLDALSFVRGLWENGDYPMWGTAEESLYNNLWALCPESGDGI